MSKAKKAVYADKQRIAGAASDARGLTPIAGSAAPSADPKKAKARKQSRGK